PRLQRPLAVQLRLNGFERSQGQRSFVLPVLRADQVVHDRVELRLQFPFAEVFDFVSGDELGHVFLLRLWASTIAASMTETQQRVSDQRLPQGLTTVPEARQRLTPAEPMPRLNDERTCGRGLQGKGENVPQCE